MFKKIIRRKIVSLIPGAVIGALTFIDGSCAVSCPYGMVNDPYPGQCPRYTDLNGDGFCDFSQSSAPTVEEKSNIPDEGHETDTIAPGLHDTNYHLIPVTLILIGLYLFTHYLFKKGYLNKKKHKRLWNILLTLGYFGTGSTGLILILVKMGIKNLLNPSITYLHSEMAIIMVVVTLFHLHLYWKPFKSIFSLKF